ncbi:uncharacterized protein [Nicotiana tomentosiformis]|uniref:uncharacterized protein n=1 Tax=Nicotiana tomentosiformis TaxID=4098 RepID=UPI00388C7D57
MTSNKDFLINITLLPIPFLVSLPNGYKVKVTCTVYQTFMHDTRPFLKKPLDLGKLDTGLYKFVWEKPSQNQATSSNVCNILSFMCDSSSFPCSVHTVSSTCNKVAMIKTDIVWHHRLAHVPFAKIKIIPEISSIISSTLSFPCTICPMARQTRLPFPDSSIHSSKPFELIHVDTWGPYHTPTYSGSKNFLTIIDNFSRSTWTHLMGSKSNAFSALKAFVTMGLFIKPDVPTYVNKMMWRNENTESCLKHLEPYFLNQRYKLKKGYKLYNLQSRQCFISRDVLFHEYHFPFSPDFPFPEIMAPTASKLPVTPDPPFSLDDSLSVASFVTSTDNFPISGQDVSPSSPLPASSPTPPVNSFPNCSFPFLPSSSFG